MTPPAIQPVWLRVLFGVSFTFMGGVGFLVGGGCGVWSFCHGLGGIRTTGTVAAVESPPGAEAGSMVPVVEYEVNGRKERVRGTVAFSPSLHSVGQTLPVVYQPTRPADALIDTFMDRWFYPLVFALPGGVLLLGGIGFLRACRKTR